MREEAQLDISEFYKFHHRMEKSSSVEEVLNILIKTVNRMIPNTDMAIVYLYDYKQKVLRLGAGFGVSTPILEKIAFQPGESLTGKVFLNQKALACANRQDVSKMMSNISSENFKWYEEGTYKRIVRSSINVPLMDKKHCIGTFTLNRYNTGKAFSQDDIKLLHTLTGQAAKMVSYVRMSKALDDSRIKEQFSQILIKNGSRKEIVDLLEQKLGLKFFLDSPDTEPVHSLPIIHNENLLGHLTMTAPLSSFSEARLNIINYAAEALGTIMSRHLDNFEKELRQRSEHFNRILEGGDSESLGKYLRFKKDVLVHYFAISAASNENTAFAGHLKNLMDRYFSEATLFFIDDHYVILSSSNRGLGAFAEVLYLRHGLITGTGRARPLKQLAISYREAVVAADHTAPPLVEYSSLGYSRLLYQLDDHEKRDFIDDQIGPLLALSPDHLSTLGALIKNGRSQKSQTAEQLHIHTNTLYQRIRRIENTLGISLQNEHQWMNVMIAYQMYVELHIQAE